MNAQQNNVAQFMQVFDQVVRTRPSIPPDEEVQLRIKLIDEEFEELQTAFVEKNVKGVADAIADLLYVIYGTACACGIDAQKVVDEVHNSNMSKLWTNSEIATLLNRDAQEIYQYASDVPLKSEDETLIAKKVSRYQWIVKNKDGKVVKGPSYQEPNIQQMLNL